MKIMNITFCLISFALMAQVPSFPNAEGFGSTATGGKGGYVVEVTNTNFSGTGSLKAALEMTGARTIIFRVGGTISNTGAEYLTIPSGSGDVTIAGETAPGEGILIRGARLRVRASNIIIRHIRFRQDPTNSTGSNDDALTIDGTSGGPLTDIMIDHCSFSYGIDGNLDIRNTWGATVQNSIISYNQKSNLINANSKDISYLNNIFGLVNERAIRANTIGHLDLTFELINNFIYGVNNPGGPSEGLRVTYENNVCEASSEFSPSSGFLLEFPAANPANGEPNTIENTYFYLSGNDLGDAYATLYKSTAEPYIEASPLYRSNYTAAPTIRLKDSLLVNAGAGAGISQGRDSVDEGLISNISAKTGNVASSGSYPTITSGTPYTDTDGDGMADDWETANGTNPSVADNNGFNVDADYTNLQMFLFFMAGDNPPAAPTCFDGIMNGDETGIDCGGSCAPCEEPSPTTRGKGINKNIFLTLD